MIGTKRHSAGFSLLEMLLATGLIFGLLIAVLMLTQSFGEREMARATNKYMETIASAMHETLSNIDNYNALYQTAMAHGGGYQLIADSTAPGTDNIAKDFTLPSVTVAGVVYPPVRIQASRLLNSQFKDNAPIRSPVRILVRVADDIINPNDTPALDIIIVTTKPRPYTQVVRAAIESSAHGGYIKTYTDKANAAITSAFGSWSFKPSSGLQNTTWYTGDLSATLDNEREGAYLAYYMYQSVEDVGGDYLYRTPDVDTVNRRRNTMYGPLNIGGNDIFGGDDINVGNDATGRALDTATHAGLSTDCQGDVLCVNGTAIVKGSATIRDRLTTNGSALINDSANLRKMRLQNGLTDADKQTYGANSHLIVDGANTHDEIDVTNNANFRDGATIAQGNLVDTTNTTLTMPDGGILRANTIDAHRVSSTTVESRTLTADNQLRAGIVSNGNVTVANGQTGVIDIHSTGTGPVRDLKFGEGLGRTLTAPRINIGTMNISNFGDCGDGCQQLGP